MTPRLWLICAIVLVLAIAQWPEAELQHAPGELISEAPEQSVLDQAEPISLEGFTVTPVAAFNLRARVLGKEAYWQGPESELSPVDLALGWQQMSDTEVLKHIEITQGNRFYFWRSQTLPIPRRAIETQSANMHMVPADEWVEDQLENVRVGSLIAIRGKLINIAGPNGWQWRSSLTREDTGNGACELIWVESITFL